MIAVYAVHHDDYFGTVSLQNTTVPDTATPAEIWTAIMGPFENKTQVAETSPGYIEDHEAYGSHHNGMITRIWYGPNAQELATIKHQELLASGVKPQE